MNEASARILPLKKMRDKNKILVHEIYASVQGESTFVGELCLFIRTTACHLRCTYCDTAHAFFEGQEKSIEEIISEVKNNRRRASFAKTCFRIDRAAV